MTDATGFAPLMLELDDWRAEGRVARFWLRDDDATEPTPALDRLLAITAAHDVPVTLAVIPEPTGSELADRLETAAQAEVAVHGFAHVNHAPPAQKKQELGAHRPQEVVLAQLRAGFEKLQGLQGGRFVPVLVPPWNRIDPALIPHLGSLGFAALSVFGPEKPSDLPLVNTHVDLIDWHGTRGGRDGAQLVSEIVARLQTTRKSGEGAMGFLTHHLVHDGAAWDFLEGLLCASAAHPACRWVGAKELIRR